MSKDPKKEKKKALENEEKALEIQLKRLEVAEKKAEAKEKKRRRKHNRILDSHTLVRAEMATLVQERDALPVLERAQGIFRLEDAVYEKILVLSSRIQAFADANPGAPITLRIFSPGGSVIHGFHLYDLLRSLSKAGHEVTTEVRGYSGSMASVLFLAGDRRLLGAESLHHQHEVATFTYGKLADIQDDIEFTERLFKKIRDIYASRTRVTKKRFEQEVRKTEWWVDARQALELGIATEVV